MGAAIRFITSAPAPVAHMIGGVDRVEGRAGLPQQHRPGLGQGDRAAGAFQQLGPEPPFELPDRPGQRRLRDPEPLGRPPEVQFLRDGDEVSQLPRLHVPRYPAPTRIDTRAVSPATRSVLDAPPGPEQDRLHE